MNLFGDVKLFCLIVVFVVIMLFSFKLLRMEMILLSVLFVRLGVIFSKIGFFVIFVFVVSLELVFCSVESNFVSGF